jgi:cell shape-determining protein MreD
MKTRILKTVLPVIPYNLLLPAVVLWELRGEKNIHIWAFFAGLVSDLIIGRTLGFSSLFYLLVLIAINFVRSKQKFNIWHALFIILVSDFIYGRLPF